MLKTILWWFSGFAGGCFLGALIACPAKSLSLPVTGVIAVVLGLIAWKIKGKVINYARFTLTNNWQSNGIS